MATTYKFEINEQLWTDLQSVVERLRDIVTDATSAFDDLSEKWQESDKGLATQTWIDEVDDLIAGIDSIGQRPEEE